MLFKKTLLEHISFISIPKVYQTNRYVFNISLCFVFLTTYFIGSLFAPLNFDPHHQGLMMQGAMSFIEGQMLYRDVYYHYGPLTAILQYFSLVIGGTSIYSLQIFTVLFYSLSSVFLCLIWSRFLPTILVLLTYVCWLALSPYFIWMLLPWSSVIALFFLVLTSYLLILNIETNKLKYLFFTGVTVALTFWARQTVGLILFFAIFLLLFSFIYLRDKNKLKGLVFYITGFFVVSSIFISWLIIKGAGMAFLNDCFINQYETMVNKISYLGFFKQVLFSLFPVLPAHTYGEAYINLWSFFPVVLIILFLEIILYIYLRRIFLQSSIHNKTWVLLSLVMISLASWIQYYPVTCIRHVFWAASPFLGIVVYYLWFTTIYIFKSGFLNADEEEKEKMGVIRSEIKSNIIVLISYRLITGTITILLLIGLPLLLSHESINPQFFGRYSAKAIIIILAYLLIIILSILTLMFGDKIQKIIRIGKKLFKWVYLLILSSIVIILLINISYRVKIGIMRYSIYNKEISAPTVLSGIKVTSSYHEGLEIISDSIRSLEKTGVKIRISSLSRGFNGKWTMFLYPLLVSQNQQYNSAVDKEIVLLHSSVKKSITDYHLLVHVKFDPAIPYDEGYFDENETDFYLYAPNL